MFNTNIIISNNVRCILSHFSPPNTQCMLYLFTFTINKLANKCGFYIPAPLSGPGIGFHDIFSPVAEKSPPAKLMGFFRSTSVTNVSWTWIPVFFCWQGGKPTGLHQG